LTGGKLAGEVLLFRNDTRAIVTVVFEASCFDDCEEVPAEFGFGGGVEKKGDHLSWVGFFQEGRKTSADTGGVDNNVAGIPEFGKGFKLGIEGGVADASPELTVADQVPRRLDEVVFEGG
jgi:hypothetical protein